MGNSSAKPESDGTDYKALVEQYSQRIGDLESQLAQTQQQLAVTASRKRQRQSQEEQEGDDLDTDDDVEGDANGAPAKRAKLEATPAAASASAAAAIASADGDIIQRASTHRVVLTLSGFKNTDDSQHNKSYKKKIERLVGDDLRAGQLPGEIKKEERGDQREHLEENVTHVIAPASARTLKVLQAILKGKWIMAPEWIEKSHEAGRWLPEEAWGFRRTENPIAGKKVYLTEDYEESYQKEITHKHCQHLVQCGAAEFTDNPQEADFILVGKPKLNSSQLGNEDLNRHQMDYPAAYVCEWADFIELLYPAHLETVLKKAALLRSDQ